MINGKAWIKVISDNPAVKEAYIEKEKSHKKEGASKASVAL